MNPSYKYKNTDQIVLRSDEFKWTTVQRSALGIPVPNLTVRYHMVCLSWHQLSHVVIPAELANVWTSINLLYEYNMFIHVSSASAPYNYDSTQSWVRYDPYGNQLILLFNENSSIINKDCCLRIANRSVRATYWFGKVINGIVRHSNNSMMSINSSVPYLIDGRPLTKTAIYLGTHLNEVNGSHLSTVNPDTCITKSINYTHNETRAYAHVLFSPKTVHPLPHREALFYVSNSSNLSGKYIPEYAIHQITPWSFAIDYTILVNLIGNIVNQYTIYCVYASDVAENYSTFDLKYDTLFLTAFNALNYADQCAHLYGTHAQPVTAWSLNNLLTAPINQLVGNYDGPTSITLTDTNPYYDKSVSRFTGKLSSYLGEARFTITGNPYYQEGHPFLYSDGLKLTKEEARLRGVYGATGTLGMELFENSKFIDCIYTSLGGTVYTGAKLPYKVYRITQVTPTNTASLDPKTYYHKVYTEISFAQIATFNSGTLTFLPSVVGDFLFIYKEGVESITIELDDALADYSLIIYSNVSENIPRLDCSTIVFLNGRELCEGVEYLRKTITNESGAIYGIEFVLLGINYLQTTGNTLEFVNLRSMYVETTHHWITRAVSNFAVKYPPTLTQLTAAGKQIHDRFGETGYIEFNDTEAYEVAIARCMVPWSETTWIPSEAVQQILQSIPPPATPVLFIRELKVTCLSAYTQYLMQEAYKMYINGTLSQLNTAELLAEWKASYLRYQELDDLISGADMNMIIIDPYYQLETLPPVVANMVLHDTLPI